uniref:DUF4817 domain-containing protein n=1 Tax=Timema douglasi TaxID=61478 RepID=A0A7R8VSP5_TIMDO|nr:unnamed protein product [Timema douglasi]
MSDFTGAEKANCVMWYEESKSIAQVQTKIRDIIKKKPPTPATIKKWHSLFKETGSVSSQSKPKLKKPKAKKMWVFLPKPTINRATAKGLAITTKSVQRSRPNSAPERRMLKAFMNSLEEAPTTESKDVDSPAAGKKPTPVGATAGNTKAKKEPKTKQETTV